MVVKGRMVSLIRVYARFWTVGAPDSAPRSKPMLYVCRVARVKSIRDFSDVSASRRLPVPGASSCTPIRVTSSTWMSKAAIRSDSLGAVMGASLRLPGKASVTGAAGSRRAHSVRRAACRRASVRAGAGSWWCQACWVTACSDQPSSAAGVSRLRARSSRTPFAARRRATIRGTRSAAARTCAASSAVSGRGWRAVAQRRTSAASAVSTSRTTVLVTSSSASVSSSDLPRVCRRS